jgi:protein-tyrosine-phosphatase
MKKVVFICNGNILRSPIAKAIYNQMAKDGSSAFSYGARVDAQGRQGQKPISIKGMHVVVNELEKFGLDISNEYCNQLKEEYIKDANKIIVMTYKEYIPEWLKKYEYEYWEVPDPEIITCEIANDIIKILKEKVTKLIS